MWFQFVELSQPESDDEIPAISNPLSQEEPSLSLQEPTYDPHNEISEESSMYPSPEPHVYLRMLISC